MSCAGEAGGRERGAAQGRRARLWAQRAASEQCGKLWGRVFKKAQIGVAEVILTDLMQAHALAVAPAAAAAEPGPAAGAAALQPQKRFL